MSGSQRLNSEPPRLAPALSLPERRCSLRAPGLGDLGRGLLYCSRVRLVSAQGPSEIEAPGFGLLWRPPCSAEMFVGPAVSAQALVNESRNATITGRLLCHAWRGGREGASEPADAGDVPDVQQEGLRATRTVGEAGRWAGSWGRGRGRGRGPQAPATGYPRPCAGGAPES